MSNSTTTSEPQPSPPSPEQIYRALQSYPFAQDADYQSGLSAILGHVETPATQEELIQKSDLVLQAQCFYFARKFNVPPIDVRGYAAWFTQQDGPQLGDGSAEQRLDEQDENPSATTIPISASPSTAAGIETPSNTPLAPPPQTQQSSSSQQEEAPPYPTSFAAIVDLITRNIPVPGIEEIPTTVLEPGSSKVDKTPRRRKPWEKDSDEEEESKEQNPHGGSEDDVSLPGQQAQAHTADGALNTTEPDVTTNATQTPADKIDILNGHRETGTGVVNILKPNAVPDSGLLGKD